MKVCKVCGDEVYVGLKCEKHFYEAKRESWRRIYYYKNKTLQKKCAECGQNFETRRKNKVVCSETCSINRKLKQRRDRNNKKTKEEAKINHEKYIKKMREKIVTRKGRYTKKECELIMSSDFTNSELADMLKRSYFSVKIKRSKLRSEMRSVIDVNQYNV